MTNPLRPLEERVLAELRGALRPHAVPAADGQASRLDLNILVLPALIAAWGLSQYLGAYLKRLGERHARGKNQSTELRDQLDRIEATLTRLEAGRKADREAIEDAFGLLKGQEPLETWSLQTDPLVAWLMETGLTPDEAARVAPFIVTVLKKDLPRLLDNP